MLLRILGSSCLLVLFVMGASGGAWKPPSPSCRVEVRVPDLPEATPETPLQLREACDALGKLRRLAHLPIVLNKLRQLDLEGDAGSVHYAIPGELYLDLAEHRFTIRGPEIPNRPVFRQGAFYRQNGLLEAYMRDSD